MLTRQQVNIEVDLDHMEFQKENGVLVLNLNVRNLTRFPNTITVHSNHTGRVVEFVQDHIAAENNEFWDGEMMQYIPTINLPNVKYIVAYPA